MEVTPTVARPATVATTLYVQQSSLQESHSHAIKEKESLEVISTNLENVQTGPTGIGTN